MCIIIVEDNDDLRRLFGRVLRNLGGDVVQTPDGRAALEAVATLMSALVVTDLMMPGMDGVELIGLLRAKPGLSAVPIMVITAEASAEAKHRALASGATDCLLKPVDLGRMLERFAGLCRPGT